jgi:hypothetical protein
MRLLRGVGQAALLAVLLIAISAAATQMNNATDVLISYWLKTNTTKMCAIDNPSRCIYVLKLNFTVDHRKAHIVWAYANLPSIGGLYINTDFDMLAYVAVNSPLTATIYIPAGYIYSSGQFSVDGMSSDRYTVCNMTLNNALLISRSGYYRVQNAPLPLYWLDPNTCTAYRYVAQISTLQNMTQAMYLYIFYMPTARAKGSWWLNGTQHIYSFRLHGGGVTFCTGSVCYRGNEMFLFPMGLGFYVTPNGTRVFTTIFRRTSTEWYGPRHFSALRNATLDGGGGTIIFAPSGASTAFTMPPPPGDGILYLYMPRMNLTSGGELVAVQNDFVAYLLLNGPYRTSLSSNYMLIYATRYAVAEVAVSDGRDVYSTRAVACPAYRTAASNPDAWLAAAIPLSRAKEIEVCNSHTITLYVGIYQTQSSPRAYSYVDEIQPGACRRLRWDGVFRNTDTQMRIFNSTRNFCWGRAWVTIAGDRYQHGWRYYITPSGSLVAAHPIDPDAFYAAAWRALMEALNQQLNATLNALQQWISQQTNATKNLSDFLRTQPRFAGTIRMDSSTSTWLRAALNELQRWQVAAPPATGGGVSASLSAPSALTASAAAAAVATAWAASRRSLATAAFLAGFAVLASSLFVYHLYGMSVAAAHILAAVLLMSVGAAAAWFRKSED